MLSVLVWLAMQGQVQTQKPDLSQLDDPGIVQSSGISSWPMCSDTVKTDCIIDTHPGLPVAPAEHVIEIKTVHHLPEGEDHCYVTTTVPNSGNDGKTLPCPPDTRELWIDGVRWGVVKGLD